MSIGQAAAPIALDRKFNVPEAFSDYKSLGAAYRRPGYEIHCSPTLVRTGENFYRTAEKFLEMLGRKELPADSRLSTPADIWGIGQHPENPREIPEFQDHFGANGYYGREITSAFLRVPRGWENGRMDMGTNRYPREIGFLDIEALKSMPLPLNWQEIGDSANSIVGEIEVPYSDWFVVRKMDNVFGIPIEVDQAQQHRTPYALHFVFDTNPGLDKISGHYDVAVGRWSGWHHGLRCLNVDAYYRRWLAYSVDGFRPVRGSFEIVSERISKF